MRGWGHGVVTMRCWQDEGSLWVTDMRLPKSAHQSCRSATQLPSKQLRAGSSRSR